MTTPGRLSQDGPRRPAAASNPERLFHPPRCAAGASGLGTNSTTKLMKNATGTLKCTEKTPPQSEYDHGLPLPHLGPAHADLPVPTRRRSTHFWPEIGAARRSYRRMFILSGWPPAEGHDGLTWVNAHRNTGTPILGAPLAPGPSCPARRSPDERVRRCGSARTPS